MRFKQTTRALSTAAVAACAGGCSFGGEPECLSLLAYNDGQAQTHTVSGADEFSCRWIAGESPSMSWDSELTVSFRGQLIPEGENLVDVEVSLPGILRVSNAESEPCVLTLSHYEIEKWTKADRHRLEGSVECGGELADPIFDDTVTQLSFEFEMYAWDELARYAAEEDDNV